MYIADDEDYDDFIRADVVANNAFEVGVASAIGDDAAAQVLVALSEGTQAVGVTWGCSVASGEQVRCTPSPTAHEDFDVYLPNGSVVDDPEHIERVCRVLPVARPILIHALPVAPVGRTSTAALWNGTGLAVEYESQGGVTLVTPVAYQAMLSPDGLRIAFLGCMGRTLSDWQQAIPALRANFAAPRMTVAEPHPQVFELAWHDLAP